jgi:hypothetical protein
LLHSALSLYFLRDCSQSSCANSFDNNKYAIISQWIFLFGSQ